MGILPAPEERFKFETKPFRSLDDLRVQLKTTFSTIPLEDGFDWSPEIKRAVRSRYIMLGMNPKMVELALGGIGYQVDLEQLDDGRVRQTWKLQLTDDTRKVFTSRARSLSE